MSDRSSLEQRIERLEAVEKINNLFSRYRLLVDDKRFDELCQELFIEDARFVGRQATAAGQAEIRQMYEDMIGVNVREARGDDEHLFGDPVIELDGDRASVNIAWSYFVKSEHGTPLLLKSGHHEDTVVKVADEWKFEEVRAFVDLFK